MSSSTLFPMIGADLRRRELESECRRFYSHRLRYGHAVRANDAATYLLRRHAEKGLAPDWAQL